MSEQEFKYVVRIVDRDLSGEKRVAYALSRIKGIGINMAFAILRKLNIDPFTKLGALSEGDIKKLNSVLRNLEKYISYNWFLNRPKDSQTGKNLHLVSSDLILKVRYDIDQMEKIKSWRGIRHSLGLKVRGQRTRTTGRLGLTVGVSRSKVKKGKEGGK